MTHSVVKWGYLQTLEMTIKFKNNLDLSLFNVPVHINVYLPKLSSDTVQRQPPMANHQDEVLSQLPRTESRENWFSCHCVSGN